MPEWSTIWAAVQGAALTLTFIVAAYQLWALRDEQCGWETLRACERYETDPVLDRVLRRLKRARDSGTLASDPRLFSLDAITVMNYLEGLAIGIKQGFYYEKIVRDHLEPMVRFHVGEFLSPSIAERMGLNNDEFSNLLSLLKAWNSGETYYRKRMWL
jgi:hypothetical protein